MRFIKVLGKIFDGLLWTIVKFFQLFAIILHIVLSIAWPIIWIICGLINFVSWLVIGMTIINTLAPKNTGNKNGGLPEGDGEF